jgi:hypothetical protein
MQVSLAFEYVTVRRMKLADHVTLNCNNYMLVTAVFLDIEKAFDTT